MFMYGTAESHAYNTFCCKYNLRDKVPITYASFSSSIDYLLSTYLFPAQLYINCASSAHTRSNNWYTIIFITLFIFHLKGNVVESHDRMSNTSTSDIR